MSISQKMQLIARMRQGQIAAFACIDVGVKVSELLDELGKDDDFRKEFKNARNKF